MLFRAGLSAVLSRPVELHLGGADGGTITTLQVDFQGSLSGSGSEYYQLDTYTGTTSTMRHVINKPVPWVCMSIITIAGGGNITGRIYVN